MLNAGLPLMAAVEAFYEHCRNVMAEVQRAEEAVAATQGEPHGLVRFSCPLGMMEVVSPLLAGFLSRHPRVNLQVVATNRRVDLIHERIEVALRVRTTLDTEPIRASPSVTACTSAWARAWRGSRCSSSSASRPCGW
ncbi:MAG TPA: LysR substrate-binding domain-containing protein [Archangium sp.]|nr:LysR substrate-binding domain-containing protein [Archangium sp.]